MASRGRSLHIPCVYLYKAATQADSITVLYCILIDQVFKCISLMLGIHSLGILTHLSFYRECLQDFNVKMLNPSLETFVNTAAQHHLIIKDNKCLACGLELYLKLKAAHFHVFL